MVPSTVSNANIAQAKVTNSGRSCRALLLTVRKPQCDVLSAVALFVRERSLSSNGVP
jgi:hypothetical protein